MEGLTFGRCGGNIAVVLYSDHEPTSESIMQLKLNMLKITVNNMKNKLMSGYQGCTRETREDESKSFNKGDEITKRYDKYISNLDSGKLKKIENKIRIFNIWNNEEKNEKGLNKNGDIDDGYVMSPLYFWYSYLSAPNIWWGRKQYNVEGTCFLADLS